MGYFVFYCEEAVVGRDLLCWRSEFTETAAIPTRISIPKMDGYGGKDTATQRCGEQTGKGTV